MSAVIFAKSAQTDLLEAWLYIAEENLTAADRVLDARDAVVVFAGVGVAAGDLFNQGDSLLGAFYRGGIRQLHVEQEIPLVLLWDEPRRRALKLPDRPERGRA